jgi:hypothetical protein
MPLQINKDWADRHEMDLTTADISVARGLTCFVCGANFPEPSVGMSRPSVWRIHAKKHENGYVELCLNHFSGGFNG